MRLFPLIVPVLFSFTVAFASDTRESSHLSWFERLKKKGLESLFAEYRQAAGDPKKYEIHDGRGVARVKFHASDKVSLVGYRIAAGGTKARGAVLVAHGNAQLAKRMVDYFQPIAAVGFDVYVYDYRSLGESPGTPSLERIFQDYREIMKNLRAQYVRSWLIGYGASAGGIVLLNAIDKVDPRMGLILDGTPDKVNFLEARAFPSDTMARDRIEKIGGDLQHVMVISGGRDLKVKKRNMAAICRKVSSGKGLVVTVKELAHPFEDDDNVSVRQARIAAFLTSLE